MDCVGTTKAGAPCKARPLMDSDRCFVHAEGAEAAATRAAARRAGGVARGKQQANAASPSALTTPDHKRTFDDLDFFYVNECHAGLRIIAWELLAGRLNAKQAQACTTGIRALLAPALAEVRSGKAGCKDRLYRGPDVEDEEADEDDSATVATDAEDPSQPWWIQLSMSLDAEGAIMEVVKRVFRRDMDPRSGAAAVATLKTIWRGSR